MRCLFSMLPYCLAFIPYVCTTYPTWVHLSWNEAYSRPPSAVMTDAGDSKKHIECRVRSSTSSTSTNNLAVALFSSLCGLT